MSKGYIYNENGDPEDVQDHSLDGYQMMHCPNCGKTVMHYLVAYSWNYGYIWMCSACLHEHP